MVNSLQELLLERAPATPLRSPSEDRPADVLRRRLRSGARRMLESDWLSALSGPLGRHYRGQSTSLLYHRVAPADAPAIAAGCSSFSPNGSLSVSTAAFEQQMHELATHHRCVTLPDALRSLRAGRAQARTVTVTFDDGYRDNMRVALPILERHGIPATIFITTGLLDRSALLWWEELEVLVRESTGLAFEWNGRSHRFGLEAVRAKWRAFFRIADLFRPLDPPAQRALMERLRASSCVRFDYADDVLCWDELRELDRHPLITIGAHTINHPVLAQLGADTVAAEMRGSRERLEQMLGHRVSCFAYPFGGRPEAGRREFALAAAAGFELAVTTRAGHWHRSHLAHPRALPRIMVEYRDSLQDFRFKLSGLEAFLRQKGRHLVTA